MSQTQIQNYSIGNDEVNIDKITFETSLVPVGGIIMWSGTIAQAQALNGWKLCDGTNGTPDLRDRFIVGAGSAYAPGSTGGANSVTLNINQIPSHNHTATDSGHTHTEEGTDGNHQQGGRGGGSPSTNNTGVGYANVTIGFSGGGQAHENRPPYYALAFIMRVS